MRQTMELAEIVRRDAVTGPNTKWFPADRSSFPLASLVGQQDGGSLAMESPLSSVSGSEEHATPVSRAQGQVIRLLPFTLVWLVLAVGIVWVLGMSWPWLLLMFGGFTAATYWRMNRDEFEFSRNGLERHRVDAYTDLREKELDQSHELKKMALTAYLEIAKSQYGDDK